MTPVVELGDKTSRTNAGSPPTPEPRLHSGEFWTAYHFKLIWKTMEFKYLKMTQLLCTVYIVIVSFSPVGSLGELLTGRSHCRPSIIKVLT
jgi:hypothetical protein